MATANFYLDTRRPKKDGSSPIRLNIRHNGKFLISTEFTAIPDRWTGTEYNKYEPNYKTKNVAIRNLINKVETYLITSSDSGKLKAMGDKTLKENIEKLLKNDSVGDKCFTDYIDSFIQTKSKKNTIETYTVTRNKLSRFDPTCSFETMDKKWLESFERSMKEAGLSTNARSIHLRNIRSVFNYAIDNEETELYPFRRFKIEKEETRKRSLKPEQLILLRDFKGEEYQREYQDIFMLMFYLIGINGIDLFNITKIIDGRVEYRREKTGKLYSIKLEPEAEAIINKHKGIDYLLNVMEKNNENYRNYMMALNRGLQKLGDFERKGLGGKKIRQPLFDGITSYWARHTWATVAAGLEIPKETISAALGHEIGSRVTSIYIDFDQRKVDEANRKVIDYINSIASPGESKII